MKLFYTALFSVSLCWQFCICGYGYMDDCVYLSDEFNAICVNHACPARADACPCLNYQQICKYYEPPVKANIFDEREVHENCVVEIWKSSATGEISIGWYENGNTETE